jgi:hypothetical protein
MAKCDFCGQRIRWIQVTIELATGFEIRNVAIDLAEPVYHFDGEKWVKSAANVNHFAVCPLRKKRLKDKIEKKQNIEKELEKNPPWWTKD